MPLVKFSVNAVAENPTRTSVEARNFRFIVDEPENLGGTDDGPNPVEYVLGALAGCLNVVGHLIAGEMGFELRGLDISIEGELDPSKFSGQPTDARAGYQSVRAILKPDTDADQDTIDKWVKAVNERCPVSDNIANATPVTIEAKKQPNL